MLLISILFIGTCESLQDKFQVVNDIGSVSNLQNGSVVRLRCRWSWFPKDGIREATCLNGKWRPKKPYCIGKYLSVRDKNS